MLASITKHQSADWLSPLNNGRGNHNQSRVGATPGKPPEDANPCASRASSGGRFQLLRAFPSSALAILTGTAVSKSWMYRM